MADSPSESFLEWLLGIAISLYGATSYIQFVSRNKMEEKLEAEIKKMQAQLDAAAVNLSRDETAIWAAIETQRQESQRFQQQIMTDLRNVPTRDDLRDVEHRITEAVRKNNETN